MNKNFKINGKTRLYGVMGDPVGHSVSPAMHNAAFRALGLDCVYLPFHVRGEALAEAIAGARAFNIRGLNVTVPHKVGVMRLLDEVDLLARQIGAVNVLVNDSGRLSGHNTDAEGFLRMLGEHGIEPRGKNIVVLGSGGAARAICFALASQGAVLTVLNRTAAAGKACVEDISKVFGGSMTALALDRENLAYALQRAAMLVNATSAGMLPAGGVTPVDRELLGDHLTVVDIVYNPAKTKLLRDAEKAGAKTIKGLEMLVWQGALSFEKWTGRQPPVNVMRRAAAAALKRYCEESSEEPILLNADRLPRPLRRPRNEGSKRHRQ